MRREENAFLFPICISAVLTTLCRDSEIIRTWRHGEESPRISIACVFKKRTFWKFLCINDCAMPPVLLTGNVIWILWSSKRPCKALQNLEIIFPTTNARRTSRGMNLKLIRELMASFQLCRNLAFGLRYTRFHGIFYMCFNMDIRSLGKGLFKTETMVWDWKSCLEMLLDNKLIRGCWQSLQTWR